MSTTRNSLPRVYLWGGALLLLLLAAGLAWSARPVLADSAPPADASPMHPVFALLDADGQNVLQSGRPLSTMQTCGQCHDTDYIAGHSFHADVGLSELTAPGGTDSGRPWDFGAGLFGKWNPLTYRYLSPAGDERLDLTTPEWLMTVGRRHVGGGPAVASREGQPLESLPPTPGDPETSIVDPQSGQAAAWDWAESGTVEMNCFLCHLPRPDNAARVEALSSGRFAWADTATLAATGIVTDTSGTWQWNAQAFDSEGRLLPQYVTVRAPSNENCAQCHGVVHTDARQPLVLDGCDTANWNTATTGQVISPQKINAGGMNIAGKDALARSWDVHAERGLKCTECHFSLNNPAYAYERDDTRPAHLLFDPRRLDIGEYLQKPSHQFARGQSAQNTVAPALRGTMRRCESCHDAANTHGWLPYVQKHLDALACESCHIPQMYAPAVQTYDWTVLRPDAAPQSACRGEEADGLIDGFQPLLMPRADVDGNTALAPYNLVTAWYWVYDNAQGGPRPVPLADLKAAWLEGGSYAPAVLAAFDADGDGALSEQELRLDTPEKQALIASRLEARGLKNPRIRGEVQPYSINHDVAWGEWALKDCVACHGRNSRLSQPMKLADYAPAGVQPDFVQDANTIVSGDIVCSADGALYYRPQPDESGLYLFGHSHVPWVDWFGALAVLGALAGVTVHGGLRYYAAAKQARRARAPRLRQVYMYAVYERFWHWLQAFSILLLAFTGLVIHKPETFGMFYFRYVVTVHNVTAAILVLNAALALFYHLTTGEIRQYIPRPRGFFDQAIVQAKFYMQGIFKGEPHPFEKTPERKLNPLQQATYFGLLNVLLPLQVLTGILMWAAGRWPQAGAALGGLSFLAPFHTLIAWLLAAFVIGHIYLTTTGPYPLAGIKAMMLGWEEVEDEHAAEEPLPDGLEASSAD